MRELTALGHRQPSILTHVFEQGQVGIVLDSKLILDQTRPLSEQLDRLEADLVEANFFVEDHLLRVGWEPPHRADGEFVVRVVRRTLPFDEYLGEMIAGRTPPVAVVTERRCRSVLQLKQIVRELDSHWRALRYPPKTL